MNAVQRFVVRLAARVAPPLRRALQGAGGSVARLEEQNTLYREALRERDLELRSWISDYREAIAMAGGGWKPRGANQPGGTAVAVSESDSTAVLQCKEAIADLELALEDRGWQRSIAMSQLEFSRWGIQQIMLICRLYRIKNPVVQRGILVSAYYVFGRGVEITSEDQPANDVIQAFLSDPRNRAELGHGGLIASEAKKYTDGNIFWALFTAVDDGQVIIRSIDAIEIEEVITDPDDSCVPWFYRRRWFDQGFDPQTGVTSPVSKEAYYVALDYEPASIPAQINGKPVMKDAAGGYVRVLHRKEGGLDKWKFGCPRAYAAVDWARAYKNRLEDDSTLVRALSRFAMTIETQGGAPAIANWKQAMATTLGNDLDTIESNPPPLTGSAIVTGPGNKITPFRSAGMTADPEGGRRCAHMAYMVFGLPETFFSDVSVGTLATATSLDRPTELKFLNDQEIWKEDLERIVRYVLASSATAPKGKLREAIKAKLAAAAEVHLNPQAIAEAVKKAAKDVTVQVKFPAILEGDIVARVGAVVAAMTLGGFETTGIDEKTGVFLLMVLLGVEDPEKVIEEMYPDKEYEPNRKQQMQDKMDQATQQATAMSAAGAPPNAETSLSQNPAMQQGAPPGAKRVPSRINPATGQKQEALRDVTGPAIAALREALVLLREKNGKQ
jgi:hypothetical protein